MSDQPSSQVTAATAVATAADALILVLNQQHPGVNFTWQGSPSGTAVGAAEAAEQLPLVRPLHLTERPPLQSLPLPHPT